MAKKRTQSKTALKGRPSAKGDLPKVVLVNRESPDGRTSVKFGYVTIMGKSPSKTVVWSNVTSGNTALNRAAKKIASPGVDIKARPGVPTFHAAPDDPKLLIRTLNGKVERGRFRDGKFTVAE